MSKKVDRVSQERAIAALRRNQRRLLDHEGVTSVGVGHCYRDGKRTDEICIVCTVEEKLSPEALSDRHIAPIPKAVTGPDGTSIQVDVVERSFRPSFQVREEPKQATPEAHDIRRTFQDPLRPGISVSHVDGTAGSIGAFVYDRETAEPLLLSNWHVLNGPTGAVGDPIVQPGPYDDPDLDGNGCGTLLRSHLGMAGDCAVARIDGRGWDASILELDRTPKRMADPDLDDLVIKSGRTTGVTRGVVSRVDVVVKINYGGAIGVQEVGGFEIRPNPAALPSNGEISMGGDSGSLWVLDVADGSADGDIALGLHFAGETDPQPTAEHAVACKITSVADKLKISLTPNESEVLDERALMEEIMARLARLESNALNAPLARPCSCGGGEGSDATAGDQLVGAEAGIPIYGNWCGPGHGGGRAIDDVDAACKTHDECYDRRGYLDCDCDRSLISAMDRLITSRRINGRARTAAVAVRAYFSAAPCVRHANIGGRMIPIPNFPPVRVPNIGGSVGRSVGGAVNRVRRRLGF